MSDTSVIPKGASQFPKFSVRIPFTRTFWKSRIDTNTVDNRERADTHLDRIVERLKKINSTAVKSGISIGSKSKLFIYFCPSQAIHVVRS